VPIPTSLKTGQISQIQSLKKYFKILKAHLIYRMSFFNALPGFTTPAAAEKSPPIRLLT
jgi:hypothetical protein